LPTATVAEFDDILLLFIVLRNLLLSNQAEILSRWGLPCKTQKCSLEPFAELRKVWWSCKLCLSMLSENKTTKVRLAAFINVIEDVFKMSCLIEKNMLMLVLWNSFRFQVDG